MQDLFIFFFGDEIFFLQFFDDSITVGAMSWAIAETLF